MASAQQVDTFIEDLNDAYEKVGDRHPGVHLALLTYYCTLLYVFVTTTQVHKTYEDNFWATKMGLAGCTAESLASSKTAYDTFLADPANLKAVRDMLQTPDITDEQKKVCVGVYAGPRHSMYTTVPNPPRC